MIKNIINNRFSSITSAAIVLGVAALASKILGLIRDRLLAGSFGAGNELDIYYAAFRVPDLIYYLLALGAISAGFIPVFVDYYKRNKKESWHLVNSLVNLMAVFLIGVCLISIIIAPWLMKLIAPGFSPEKLSMTVDLTRVMFLSPLLLGISAIFGGVLQGCRRFLVYSLAPILYNLGIIFGIVFLVKYFGLMGLAWGVVLGALAHLIIQFLAALQCGFRWHFSFDYKFDGVKRVFKMMPSRFLSMVLNQVNVVFMTVMASGLAIGSIAVYSLAYNIWAFPLGVFGISFVTASFPRLSEQAQLKNVAGFVKTFSATARQILFFTLPAAALFIVLRAQIVRVVLGTGQFSWENTILTLETLSFFCLSLFAEALIWLFLRGFFAWEDARTPFLLGILATIIRLGSAWLLAYHFQMGVAGLALGFSIGGLVYLLLLFIFLSEKLRKISCQDSDQVLESEKELLVADLKMILATFLAGLAAYRMLYLIAPLVDMQTGLGILIQGSLAGLVGLLVYGLLAWFLRIPELKQFLKIIIKKLPWKKIPRDIGELNGK